MAAAYTVANGYGLFTAGKGIDGAFIVGMSKETGVDALGVVIVTTNGIAVFAESKDGIIVKFFAVMLHGIPGAVAVLDDKAIENNITIFVGCSVRVDKVVIAVFVVLFQIFCRLEIVAG